MTTETPRILRGDCISTLDDLPAGCADLVFADPPYNQGVNYGNGAAADRLPEAEYLDWCDRWVTACRRVLAAEGSMWVLIADEYAAELAVMLKAAGLHRRNWITWVESFGVQTTRKFARHGRHLLYFVAHPRRFTFNAAPVMIPSDRQTKYNDKRANPDGKVMGDVWQFNRVAGTHKERLPGFPTQLPLDLLRRIVAVASNPGDLVLDPFCGSGTTGVAALEAGRQFIGIDANSDYVAAARERIHRVTQGVAG